MPVLKSELAWLISCRLTSIGPYTVGTATVYEAEERKLEATTVPTSLELGISRAPASSVRNCASVRSFFPSPGRKEILDWCVDPTSRASSCGTRLGRGA